MKYAIFGSNVAVITTLEVSTESVERRVMAVTLWSNVIASHSVTAAHDGKFGYTSSEEGFYFEAPVAAEPKVVAILKWVTSLTSPSPLPLAC
jgi:hypothetical protein